MSIQGTVAEKERLLVSSGGFGMNYEELDKRQCYFPRRYCLIILTFFGLFLAYLYRVILSVCIIPISSEFGYDDSIKGIMLSSFFWGYIVTQVPGGYLAQSKFGAKKTIGCGLLIASVFTMITPFAAYNKMLLLAARVFTGLGEGVVYPCTHHIMARWLPPKERGIVGVAYSGSNVGTAAAMFFSPFIIRDYHWQSVFFISGGAGLIWCTFWFLFVHETPESHLKKTEATCLPISVLEVRKINEELPLNLNEKSSNKIPWAGFFSSGAVWAIIVAYFTQAWGFYVLLTWLPTYMKQKHGLKIEDAGFYSLLPFLGLSFSVPIFGKLADFLYNKKIMSKLAVRKSFQALGEFGPALFLFLIGLLEPPTALSVLFMTIAVTMAGWQMGGVNVNHIDLSPKYAGLLLGISNTAGTLPGIFGVGLTGFILDATDQSWPTVFWLASGIYAVGAVLYLILAKAKVTFI